MKKYKTRNIQLKRFYLCNHLYFVTTTTEDRTQVFLDEKNVLILLDVIRKYSHRHAVKIHAFVVLPDHMHLLVTPTTDAFTISDFMRGIKGRSAIEINRRAGTVKTSTVEPSTVETVPTNICRHEFIRAIEFIRADRANAKTCIWQHQFLDHVVRNNEDYKLHIEYIHNNPVKHNLCRGPEEYRWSSYRHYMYDEDVLIPIAKLPL